MGRVGRVLRWVVRGRPRGIRARLGQRLRACVDGAAPDPPDVAAPGVAPAAPGAAPLPGVDVCGVDELAPGQLAEFVVQGVPVALANVGGTFHAVSNVCPHAGGPLGDGELDGHEVACPLHGWTFDVRTGACGTVPALSVAVYPVVVEHRRVRVVVDAHDPGVGSVV